MTRVFNFHFLPIYYLSTVWLISVLWNRLWQMLFPIFLPIEQGCKLCLLECYLQWISSFFLSFYLWSSRRTDWLKVPSGDKRRSIWYIFFASSLGINTYSVSQMAFSSSCFFPAGGIQGCEGRASLALDGLGMHACSCLLLLGACFLADWALLAYYRQSTADATLFSLQGSSSAPSWLGLTLLLGDCLGLCPACCPGVY